MTIEEKRKKQSEYQKAHYKKKKQYYKDKAALRRKEIKLEFEEIKSKLFCKECGETHISCLDFHHTNPNEKDIEVSSAVCRSWSKKKIEDEIKKCIVLCANCHRKLHYKEKLGIRIVD